MLDQASVGLAPTVKLSCDTDPALTDEQQARLKDKSDAILATGREDAAKPLGENRIYPDVPHQILKAQVPAVPVAGQAGAAAAVGPDGSVADSGTAGRGEHAGWHGGWHGNPGRRAGRRRGRRWRPGHSAVAQQERGPRIEEAVGQGQPQMVTGQQDKQQQEESAQKDHEEKVAAAIKEHTDEQTAERAKAKREARDQRKTWQTEQDTAVGDADTKARKDHDDTRGDIKRAKNDTDGQIGDQQKVDNKSIADKRREAEEEARKERDKEKEPSGWLSRIGSAIANAFDHLVNFVKDAFNRARKFVQGVIDKFKNFVIGLIEKARQAIVGFINKLADALIEIGNKLLAAFPGLRDKFRKRIEKFRDDAIHAVNKIANRLKTAVTKLLDALSKALTKLFDALEKALVAAVQFVRNAIVGVINFVKNAIDMLGDFAALVKDVAVDPGGWISKLKTAVVDGINIYLWDAVKTAVKKWFDDKVEEITGLGKMVIDVLRKGCFSMAMIARKVWDALISALPGMLVQTAIEQLLAIVIPGAGAIMAIVRGAIAAYHAVSKIIAAIGKFIAFLKAVRSGQAARPFAEALAAGVVALLEFIASFLMSKLASAAKGVAGALKGIADRIVKFLARGAKAVKKGMGAAVNVAKRSAKVAAGAIKRGFHAVVRGGKRGAKWIAAKAKGAVKAIGRGTRALGGRLAKTRLGKSLANAGHKLKAKYQQFKAKTAAWRDRYKKWRENRKKNKPTPEQRLAQAAERIRPNVRSVLRRGIRGIVMRALLGALRLRYRLSGLEVSGMNKFDIRAWINPGTVVISGVTLQVDRLLKFIRQVSSEMIQHGSDLQSQANQSVGLGVSEDGKPMHIVPEGTPGGQIAAHFRQLRAMKGGEHDVIRFERSGDTPIDVTRMQMRPRAGEPDTRNRLILMDRLRRRAKQSRETGLDYHELKALTMLSGRARARSAAGDALNLLKGEIPRGQDGRAAVQVATWVVFQEQHRNVSALTTSAMALDLTARGIISPRLAVKMLPMSMKGAQAASNRVDRYLYKGTPILDPNVASMSRKERKKERAAASKADSLMRAEVELVNLWVMSLEGLEFLTDGDAMSKEQHLLDQIRQRLYKIYNVPSGYRGAGIGD